MKNSKYQKKLDGPFRITWRSACMCMSEADTVQGSGQNQGERRGEHQGIGIGSGSSSSIWVKKNGDWESENVNGINELQLHTQM